MYLLREYRVANGKLTFECCIYEVYRSAAFLFGTGNYFYISVSNLFLHIISVSHP